MANKMPISNEQFEYLWQNISGNLSNESGSLEDISTEFDLDQLDQSAEFKPGFEPGELFDPLHDDSGYSNSDGETSMSPTPSPTHKLASTPLSPNSLSSAQSLPSTTAYPGPYSFAIGFEHQPKDTKATSWTYSPLLHKLFVRMGAPCPIRFQTAEGVPAGSVVRALMVYSKPEHVQEPVRRCANHASEADGHPAPTHLLRCQHASTQYSQHPTSHRLSLSFPLDAPQPGARWTTNLFQWVCFSSCVGGLNRRPVKLIFTLESPEGQVLGRQSVEIRICACPGRDRKQEERALDPKPAAPRAGKRKASALGPQTSIDLSSASKRLKQQDEVFTLTVVGLHNFQMLSQIRDCLELASMIPGVQVQQYKQQQAGGASNLNQYKQTTTSTSSMNHYKPAGTSSAGIVQQFKQEQMGGVASIQQRPLMPSMLHGVH